MQFPCVEEVEHLHHDKSIKNDGKVPGVVFGGCKGVFVIFVAVEVVKSATADSPAQKSISPAVLRVTQVGFGRVNAVRVFRNESFAHEDQNHHNGDLKKRLNDDVFEHCFVNDIVISRMRFSL